MKAEEKNKILGRKLDDNELEKISGGMHRSAQKECHNGSIVGGCVRAYYNESCHATVEAGSSCWSVDFRWEAYTVTQGAKDKYNVIDHPEYCTSALQACIVYGYDE